MPQPCTSTSLTDGTAATYFPGIQSGSKIGFDAVETLARMLKPLLYPHKRRVGTGCIADDPRERMVNVFQPRKDLDIAIAHRREFGTDVCKRIVSAAFEGLAGTVACVNYGANVAFCASAVAQPSTASLA
jgi:hypothetical protein